MFKFKKIGLVDSLIILSIIVVVTSLFQSKDPYKMEPRHIPYNEHNYNGPESLLAMLAKFRIQTTRDRIAQLAGTDAQGTCMHGLKEAADTLGMKAIVLMLSQKDLERYVKEGVGVIALVNDHYVWVKEIQPGGVLIKDIQPGFRFVSLEEWHAMWFAGKTSDGEGLGYCMLVSPNRLTLPSPWDGHP